MSLMTLTLTHLHISSVFTYQSTHGVHREDIAAPNFALNSVAVSFFKNVNVPPIVNVGGKLAWIWLICHVRSQFALCESKIAAIVYFL